MAEEAVTLTLEVKDRMTGALKDADAAVAGLSDSLDDTAKSSKPSRFGFADLGKQLQVVNRMALAGAGTMSRIGKGMSDAARMAVGLGKQAVGSLKSFAGGFGNVGKAASDFVGRLRTVGGQIGATMKAGVDSVRSFASRSVGHVQMFVSGFKDATAAASGFTGRMGTLGGKVRESLDVARGKVSEFVGKVKALGAESDSGIVQAFRSLPGRLAELGSRAGEALRGAMQKGLDGARKAAEIAGTAIIGTLSVALVGGAKRLVGLDNAEAKLRGLGNSAKDVEGIMGDVTKSIEGTTFRLDDAATVAASAVAAGIQPGEQLQRMLTDVGNAAKAGGVEMSEMGAIFNKVVAFQKADTGDINMIAERGLPIWAKLAESMGVSQDEVKKLVSDGKVGFEEFSDAVRLAGGTVAEEMNNTLSGQAANIPAYLSMMGASMLSGMKPVLMPVLQGINDLLASLAPAIEPFGQALGDALIPAAEKVGAVLSSLAEGGLGGFTDKLAEFMPLLGPIIGAVVAFGSKALQTLPVVGKFLPVLNPVLGAIVGLIAASPELRSGLFEMIGKLVPVVLGLFEQLAPVLDTFISLILSVVSRLVPVLMPLIGTIVEVAAVVAGSLVSAMTQILPPVLDLVSVLVDLVFSILKPLIPIVSFVAKVIGVVLAVAIQVVAKIITWLVNLLSAVLIPVIQWLGELFENLGPAVVGVWEWIQQAAGAVADWFTGTLVPAFQAVWDGITAAADWAYNYVIKPIFTGLQIAFLAVATIWTLYWNTVLKPVIDGFAAAALWLWHNAITPTLNGIKSAWQWMVDGIVAAWNNIGKPMLTAVGTAIRWLKDAVWTPVVNALKTAWNLAMVGVRAIWTGVLKPTFDAVGSGIRWLKDNVWSPVASAMQSAWKTMGDGIKSVKTSVIDPVFEGLKTGVRKVGESFEKAKDVIGTAWDKLKELTAKPVRFVVNDVYNDGIRKTWNGIAEAVKLDNLKMPKFNLGFASGGVLPGYTPGRDVHRFTSPTAGNLYLSGGEAIMRPEFTRAIGGEEGVHRLNALARSGRVEDVHRVVDHAFASGGVFPSGPVAGINAFADSGVWRGLWAIVKDKFPTARLTSAYRPGSNTASGNRSHHARGNAVDLAGPRSMDTKTMGRIFEFLRGNYGNSNEIIYSPANGRQIKNGRNYMYQGAVRRMHYNHVHWANTRVPAGAPDYDPGGDGGGGGFLSQLFDLNPLKAFAKKFEGLDGGGWGQMIGAAGKNLVDSLVEKISPFQFGDEIADVGEQISKGAAYAKGQTWATLNGLSTAERNAMNYIVKRESSWNPKAQNPRSTASGLPQMINSTARAYLGGAPAKKFGVFKQLDGMKKYVHSRYGGWGGALSYWQRNKHYADGGVMPMAMGIPGSYPVGLYDNGGIIPGGGAVAVSKTRDPELVSTAAQARAQTELLRAAADREKAGATGDTFYVEVNIEGVDLSDHPGMERVVKSGIEAAIREARERR